MGDTDEKKLSLDFSQDRDLEAIKAKVLAFLKDDVAESGTITCVIRAGEDGGTVPRVYHLGLGQAELEVVETSARKIASDLTEYAKGKMANCTATQRSKFTIPDRAAGGPGRR
jgi:hypothetical protein